MMNGKYKIAAIFLLLLLTGCSTPVKKMEGSFSSDKQEGLENYKVYAKLTDSSSGWKLTDYCIEPSQRIFKSVKQCDKSGINKISNGYVELSSMRPAYSTATVQCTTILVSMDDCPSGDFWHRDVKWKGFLQYIFIIPLVTLSYQSQVYFDANEFNAALNEALSKNTTAAANLVSKQREAELSEEEVFAKAKVEREAKRDADRKADEAIEKTAQAKFNQEAAKPKSIGGTVCSYDNWVGIVTGLDNRRIRVTLSHKLSSLPKYAFFYPYSMRSRYTEPGNSKGIWADTADWARCDGVETIN